MLEHPRKGRWAADSQALEQPISQTLVRTGLRFCPSPTSTQTTMMQERGLRPVVIHRKVTGGGS